MSICFYCKGTGKQKDKTGSVVTCPGCSGSGKAKEATNV